MEFTISIGQSFSISKDMPSFTKGNTTVFTVENIKDDIIEVSCQKVTGSASNSDGIHDQTETQRTEITFLKE